MGLIHPKPQKVPSDGIRGMHLYDDELDEFRKFIRSPVVVQHNGCHMVGAVADVYPDEKTGDIYAVIWLNRNHPRYAEIVRDVKNETLKGLSANFAWRKADEKVPGKGRIKGNIQTLEVSILDKGWRDRTRILHGRFDHNLWVSPSAHKEIMSATSTPVEASNAAAAGQQQQAPVETAPPVETPPSSVTPNHAALKKLSEEVRLQNGLTPEAMAYLAQKFMDGSFIRWEDGDVKAKEQMLSRYKGNMEKISGLLKQSVELNPNLTEIQDIFQTLSGKSPDFLTTTDYQLASAAAGQADTAAKYQAEIDKLRGEVQAKATPPPTNTLPKAPPAPATAGMSALERNNLLFAGGETNKRAKVMPPPPDYTGMTLERMRARASKLNSEISYS